ncbi:hypothetical protein ABH931_003122 [Streptacidiphilus sp. MAP12-33]|uniref:hypothetical protein n=1 Tax=Streptacidiphilus sp. MAP12-33 TaxID=3156266 RepID=UPI0035137240
MTITQRDISTDPYRLAIVAAERLRNALTAHGIAIPSLRGSHPVRETPFVELGGCTAEVAEALATVLEKIQPEDA